MIEETAVVAKIERNQIWVEGLQKQGCGGCLQKSTCSTSIIDKYIRKRTIEVDSDIELKLGDEVVIAIDEGTLIKASLLLYLLPLVFMVAGGGVAEWLIAPAFGQADWIVAVAAVSSLLLSLWAISKLQRAFFFPYFSRPVVIKKISG